MSGRGVGRRGRRAGGHRRDQQAALGGAGWLLAVLAAAADYSDDVSDLQLIAARLSVGPHGHPGQHLSDGIGQPQRGQIVDLVYIVELGGQQHLLFVVEGGVVAEVQVIEVTEVMEIV